MMQFLVHFIHYSFTFPCAIQDIRKGYMYIRNEMEWFYVDNVTEDHTMEIKSLMKTKN